MDTQGAPFTSFRDQVYLTLGDLDLVEVDWGA